MIKKFRLKFEPVRVIESSTTEGTPAQQYIEATVVADQHDKSLHHDELWKTPGPVGQLTLTIHQPEAITLFGRRQPFYAELLLEDGKEAPSKSKSATTKKPSSTKATSGRSGRSKKRSTSKKRKSTASSTASPARGLSSRSKPKSSTPSTETVKRKAAGSRTSATPVQPQPVTTPGGNE